MAKISTSTNIDNIQLQEQGSAPTTPASGYGRIYCKSDGLYFIGDDGVEVGPLGAGGSGTDTAGAYLLYRDEKAQNTAGGGSTSGSWQTRVINTEVSDAGGHGSLSSNQITLAAGTYRAHISVPFYSSNAVQTRLQNITDGTTTLLGTSEYGTSSDNPTYHSFIIGRFTIAAPKVFEVQYQCLASKATNGLGVQANFATEIYTVAEFIKEP